MISIGEDPLRTVAPVAADVPISLETEEVKDQIDLDGPGATQLPDEKTAGERAVKAHIAFGKDSPGPEQLRTEILTGNEGQLRERLAVARDHAAQQFRLDVIQNVAAEKAKKGLPMTEDDVKFIQSLSEDQLRHDPSTILESEYARQYFNIATQLRGGENVLTTGLQGNPDETSQEMDVASNIKTRQEIVKTEIQGLARRWEQTGWGSAIASHLGRFIPLLENYRLRSSKEDAILPGSNLAQRVQRLWAMPPEAFARQLKADVVELEKLNPLTAMKYAQAALSFSSDDEFLDNAFGIVDVATLPVVGTAKVAVKGVRAAKQAAEAVPSTVQEVKKALKDSLKADAQVSFKSPEQVLEQAGDVEQAAQVTAYKDALKQFSAQDPLAEKSRMIDAIPSLFNVDKLLQGTHNLSREAATRLRETLMGSASNLLNAVSGTSRVIRLEEGSEALAKAMKSAEERLRTAYPHLNDAVLDVSHIRAEDHAANIHMADMRLGKSDNAAKNNPNVRAAQPLFKGKFTVAQATASKARYEHELERIRVTVSDPIERKRSPKMVEHLEGQATIMRDEVERIDKFLASTKPVQLPAEAKVVLGTPDATLFKDAKEADFWAREVYKIDPAAYRVKTEQQGVGFYISVRAPIDETEDGVRDLLISTKHQTPVSVTNTFLGVLKTPEDTLSVANRENRHIATHGAQELHRLAKDTATLIGQLPNKSIKKLDQFLAENRDFMYTEKDQIRRGFFHQSVGEFDTAWTSKFHRAPTEQERTAYFAAVQLNDWDWTFRNLSLYRDKARQGIEKYAFAHQVKDEATGDMAMVKTPYIEGRIRKDIPWEDTENAGIWVYDKKTNSGTFFDKNKATGEQRADLTNKINIEGYKIVQVANPIDKPVRKIADHEETVHFIVVPDVDRAPLDWKQLPYRPGGHVEYQYEHWVKQVSVRQTEDGRNVYEGDVSIFNQATEAEAKIYAQRMDHARQLLKDNKIDELKDYLSGNLPYNLGKFKALFEETTLENGAKVPARLNVNDPIRHTISGRNLVDAHPDIERLYDNFENQIRSSYNLYGNIDKKYASQREGTLGTVKERMGESRAIFELEPSKLINPLNTLNRAMANIMRGRYLNDYKIQSVETFVQEFGDLLKVEGGLAEIRKNPVYYLHNAPWDTQTPEKGRLAAGMNAQRAILTLLGTQSELGSNLRWAQENVLNFIYQKAGQGTSDFVAEHMLPVTKDPFRYVRGMAFHSKLGLFNPVQLFLQAQTLTHVAAVSGIDNGMRGISAATLMRRLSLTEDKKIIEHFGQMATKFGWKKEDFIESYQALKKTGLYNVEGEVAFRDDVFDPKLFNGTFGNILDKGTFFFREGERLVRLTAWNAAFREWKVANPARALDNKALAEILARQNTLSVNMTRASSAWWQQGVLSIPTQFFSYQARLMEQFLGKRLTPAEKARAFITYSAMYGVPTATGAVTFAWPWYEDVRQAALERGIDVNSPGMRAIMEGIPSTMIQMITGNEQNYAQRLGPGGVQYFKDVFAKGKVMDAFGASPKILAGMANSVAPLAKAVMSPFVPGMGDWKFTAADFIVAAEEISTLGNVGRAIYAFNTGKYISRNEVDLGPASSADAVLTAIIGTQPLRVTDAFIMSEMAQEQRAMQQTVKKEAIKNFRRALREFREGNDEAAGKYLQNGKLQLEGGGFRVDERNKIMQEAITGYESFLDKMNQDYIRSAPEHQYWDRIERVFRVKRPNEEKQ